LPKLTISSITKEERKLILAVSYHLLLEY